MIQKVTGTIPKIGRKWAASGRKWIGVGVANVHKFVASSQVSSIEINIRKVALYTGMLFQVVTIVLSTVYYSFWDGVNSIDLSWYYEMRHRQRIAAKLRRDRRKRRAKYRRIAKSMTPGSAPVQNVIGYDLATGQGTVTHDTDGVTVINNYYINQKDNK